MYETSDDIEWLQQLLAASHAAGGRHLQDVIASERRLSARQVIAALEGMRLLVLATATADGRPIAGPVDGIFYRGRFHFGSAPDAVRFRHIGQRPAVSATHLPGEELAITVHGNAAFVDLKDPQHAELRQCILDVYVPRYGAEWEQFMDSGPLYARIEPTKMFTYTTGS